MTDLERYLLEEWVEEYRTGRLLRREVLRRLAVYAGGAALGAALAEALGLTVSSDEVAEAAAGPPPAPGGTTPQVAPDDPRVEAATITFPDGTVTVLGYLAKPRRGPRAPGIVVIHENRGLVEHIKDVARRLARAGYVALAPDLASPEGGTDRFSDPAAVTALLGRTPPARLVSMLNAAVGALQRRPDVYPDRVGAVGFCFGGGLAWRLATSNPSLRAVVPFYGPNPPLEDVPKIRAAILAIYGALDQRIDAGIPEIRNALEKAGIVHEVIVYPGADHAFFNDTGPRYNARAAGDAWARTLAWFAQHLAP
jgi:carboxymethylenebutenolidase